MQYTSPLHFIELPAGAPPERKDLLLARKKMLAELELSGGQSMTIKGRAFSKNDIIRFFDELQESASLSWHLAVYHDKVLLGFLEQGRLEVRAAFASDPLYGDKAFIDWISPYYAHSFKTYFSGCFRELAVERWATLISCPLLMNSYDQIAAWEQLEKIIRTVNEKMEHLCQTGIARTNLQEVNRLCDARRLKMISGLPSEYFSRVRDEIAFSLMRVSIVVFNNYDRSWALITIRNAGKLAVSEATQQQVYNKLLEMQGIVNKTILNQRSLDPRKWSTSTWIIVSVFALLIVIGIVEDTRKKAESNALDNILYPNANSNDGSMRADSTTLYRPAADSTTLPPHTPKK